MPPAAKAELPPGRMQMPELAEYCHPHRPHLVAADAATQPRPASFRH